MSNPDYKPFIRTHADEESTFSWLYTHFIMLIPGVNVLVLLRWCMSSRTSESKRRYALSVLIFLGIHAVVFFFAWQVEAVRVFVRGPALDRFVELVGGIENGEPRSLTIRYRTFTDIDGRKMEARVQRFTGSKVIIERRDGEVFEADLNRFSHADRDYLMELRNWVKEQ